MSFVLFVLGVAAAAAGVLMIGFGIPINEFSLGNTLIIAGTTALASGLVVIGLSVVARQLSKIADLLLSRPAGPASGRSSDMLEQGGGGGRMPAPRSAHPAEAAPPRAPAPSPSYDPMPSYDPIEDLPPPPPPPAPRPRIPGFGAPPAPPTAPAAAADPNAGQRGWRPPGTRQAAPPVEPSVRQEPSIGVPERTPRPAAQEPSFDAIWPSDRRAERIEPQHDLPPEPAAAPAPPRLNGDATIANRRPRGRRPRTRRSRCSNPAWSTAWRIRSTPTARSKPNWRRAWCASARSRNCATTSKRAPDRASVGSRINKTGAPASRIYPTCGAK